MPLSLVNIAINTAAEQLAGDPRKPSDGTNKSCDENIKNYTHSVRAELTRVPEW